MSIKFYPLGNLPSSSSFSVSSSLSENNLVEILTTSASFAENTAASIIPAPRGLLGRNIIFDIREKENAIIELDED